MKITNRIIIFLAAILLVGFLANLIYLKSLKNKNLAYRHSITALTNYVTSYKVKDSLNAIQVKALEVSLSEYKKINSENAKLIKKFKADKAKTITDTKVETAYKMATQIKDTIVYKDSAKVFNYTSYWTDIKGIISQDTCKLDISNREELLLVESIQRKRFLFFKLPPVWPFGYKSKTIDIISKNPNTTIVNAEHVNFR